MQLNSCKDKLEALDRERTETRANKDGKEAIDQGCLAVTSTNDFHQIQHTAVLWEIHYAI